MLNPSVDSGSVTPEDSLFFRLLHQFNPPLKRACRHSLYIQGYRKIYGANYFVAEKLLLDRRGKKILLPVFITGGKEDSVSLA